MDRVVFPPEVKLPSPTPQAAPEGSPSKAATPGPSATSGPSELVTRPDPGLARGKWEAPKAAFYAVAAIVVLLGIFTVLSKLGVLARFRKSKS